MRKQMTMQRFRVLTESLPKVILLLVGLEILTVLLVMVFPFVPYDNFGTALIVDAGWIARGVFGLTIFWLARREGFSAIPVGILSILLPTYGAIFYILMTIQNKRINA